MEKTTVNGYDTLTWNGITIRATSDGRIEIDLPRAEENLCTRLYVQPMENGVNCMDHNTGENIDLEYAPE